MLILPQSSKFVHARFFCPIHNMAIHSISMTWLLMETSAFFLCPLCISSVAQSCLTLCLPPTAVRLAFLSVTNPQSLLKLMSMALVMPSKHFILCHPLLLPPSIFSSIRVFSNESVIHIRWPKYWSFSFNVSPSNEYSGLISFRMDWLDLLVVQGTLKNLLLHHSSKASVLQHSAFFIVQLSQPYMTTGKTIVLTRRTFVGKALSWHRLDSSFGKSPLLLPSTQ